MDKLVIVTVRKGIYDAHTVPKGVKVKIVDFDIEGLEDDEVEKFEGKDAYVVEYTHKGT